MVACTFQVSAEKNTGFGPVGVACLLLGLGSSSYKFSKIKPEMFTSSETTRSWHVTRVHFYTLALLEPDSLVTHQSCPVSCLEEEKRYHVVV